MKVLCLWHDEKTASCNLRVGTDGTLSAKCFGCGKGGSVLDLIAARYGLGMRGSDFARVVELGEQLAGIAPPEATAPPDLDAVMQLLAESVPDPGPVAAYFRSRGLTVAVPTVLRFHPTLAYHENKKRIARPWREMRDYQLRLRHLDAIGSEM